MRRIHVLSNKTFRRFLKLSLSSLGWMGHILKEGSEPCVGCKLSEENLKMYFYCILFSLKCYCLCSVCTLQTKLSNKNNKTFIVLHKWNQYGCLALSAGSHQRKSETVTKISRNTFLTHTEFFLIYDQIKKWKQNTITKQNNNTYIIRASHSKKFSSFTGPVWMKWVSLINYPVI